MLFLATDPESANLFLCILIALAVCALIIISLILLKTHDLFPFRRMKKDQEDNCYDMNLRINMDHTKSKNKKDEKVSRWKA